jgi:hypothetical protein
VDVAPRSADPRAAAVIAELSPYGWRDLTASMLARRVVGAAERYSVIRLIHSVPGAAVGELEPLEPAASSDPRVESLARALQDRRWREFSVDRLCAHLLAALDAWQAQRESFDAGVRRFLDDR